MKVIKVMVVKENGRKAAGWFEEHQGTIFEVMRTQDDGFGTIVGYDVDMAPLGRPGELGWMHAEEVEIVEAESDELEAVLRSKRGFLGTKDDFCL